jgi:hypothetical protein
VEFRSTTGASTSIHALHAELTMHWQPLDNYSDPSLRVPRGSAQPRPFRRVKAFKHARAKGFISAIHWGRADMEERGHRHQNRLQPYLPNLKLVAEDPQVVIYEVIAGRKFGKS